nr:MAG TPA: hypothetical protein [Caudoviricetes sp.]
MLFLDFLTLCTEPGIYFYWSFLFFSVVERLTRPAPCCPLCPAGGGQPQRTQKHRPRHARTLDTLRRVNRDGGGRWRAWQCVRNCADLDTLKHERFSTQECVQNH